MFSLWEGVTSRALRAESLFINCELRKLGKLSLQLYDVCQTIVYFIPDLTQSSTSFSSAGSASPDSVDVTSVSGDYNPSTQMSDMTAFGTERETIYECSARLLFMAVRWAKNLPSFANLPFRDQVSVLCQFDKK